MTARHVPALMRTALAPHAPTAVLAVAVVAPWLGLACALAGYSVARNVLCFVALGCVVFVGLVVNATREGW